MPNPQTSFTNKQKLFYAIATIVIGAGLVVAYTSSQPAVDPPYSAPINSFEKCAAAGNPILESYPEQCVTKDGKHFTRILTEKEKKNLQP